MLQGIAAGACPRCSATLHRLESERVEYSACDGCGGVWLEHGRLGALLLQPPSAQEQILKEVAKTHTGRIKKLHPEIFCPHCGLIMFVAPMGMLTQRPVATCPKCNAAFLDHGILDEIMRNRGGGW
jgi:Zn-finger nucleic acid-binding protein